MMRKNLGYIRQQKDISEEKRMKKNVWIAGVTALLSAGLVWIAPVSTLADERIPGSLLEPSVFPDLRRRKPKSRSKAM